MKQSLKLKSCLVATGVIAAFLLQSRRRA